MRLDRWIAIFCKLKTHFQENKNNSQYNQNTEIIDSTAFLFDPIENHSTPITRIARWVCNPICKWLSCEYSSLDPRSVITFTLDHS
jgi:hypothetical protein